MHKTLSIISHIFLYTVINENGSCIIVKDLTDLRKQMRKDCNVFLALDPSKHCGTQTEGWLVSHSKVQPQPQHCRSTERERKNKLQEHKCRIKWDVKDTRGQLVNSINERKTNHTVVRNIMLHMNHHGFPGFKRTTTMQKHLEGKGEKGDVQPSI